MASHNMRDFKRSNSSYFHNNSQSTTTIVCLLKIFKYTHTHKHTFSANHGVILRRSDWPPLHCRGPAIDGTLTVCVHCVYPHRDCSSEGNEGGGVDKGSKRVTRQVSETTHSTASKQTVCDGDVSDDSRTAATSPNLRARFLLFFSFLLTSFSSNSVFF